MSRAYCRTGNKKARLAAVRTALTLEVTGSLGHIDPVGVRFRVPVDDELTFAGL
jgi:hypothetical protein